MALDSINLPAGAMKTQTKATKASKAAHRPGEPLLRSIIFLIVFCLVVKRQSSPPNTASPSTVNRQHVSPDNPKLHTKTSDQIKIRYPTRSLRKHVPALDLAKRWWGISPTKHFSSMSSGGEETQQPYIFRHLRAKDRGHLTKQLQYQEGKANMSGVNEQT